MKCKCGKPVAFWDQVFGSNRCFDCKFLDDLKEKVAAIKKVMKEEPRVKLSKLAKGYLSVAKDYGI